MKHRQTETRHLFHPEKPDTNAGVITDASLEELFTKWLDTEAPTKKLENLMHHALPQWTHTFIHVFVGKDSGSRSHYIAVSWQETCDRQAINWGDTRPDHIEKYTVRGAPHEMLRTETIAAILTMLPPENT